MSDPPDETRSRLSAEETRELLLESARRELDFSGVPPDLSHISFEAVIADVGVPRSSAYSAWSAPDSQLTPQQRFKRELLRRAIVDNGMGVRDLGALNAAAAAVLDQWGDADTRVLVTEIVRTASHDQYVSSINRPGFRVSLAVFFAAVSGSPDDVDEEMLGWLGEADLQWTDHLSKSLIAICELVGLTPRPELDGPLFWRRLAMAISALGEGLSIRTMTGAESVQSGIELPGPDGELVPWTIFGIANMALIDRFFILDGETQTPES